MPCVPAGDAEGRPGSKKVLGRSTVCRLWWEWAQPWRVSAGLRAQGKAAELTKAGTHEAAWAEGGVSILLQSHVECLQR